MNRFLLAGPARLSFWGPSVLGFLLLLGCDQETFLGGKWRPTEWKNENQDGDSRARELGFFLGVCENRYEEACAVFPEFVFGHYGSEVVGISRLSKEAIGQSDVKCPDTPEGPAVLRCTRIETQYSEPTLVFDLYLCDEDGSRRVEITRIDSDNIDVSISPARVIGGDPDHPEVDCSAEGVCPKHLFRLTKTADEGQLSTKDKNEETCEPNPRK